VVLTMSRRRRGALEKGSLVAAFRIRYGVRSSPEPAANLPSLILQWLSALATVFVGASSRLSNEFSNLTK